MSKSNKTQIQRQINSLGLPESTVFCGYAIHLPDSDEFLMKYGSSALMDGLWWSKIPEMAKIFKQHEKAVKVRDKFTKEANVVWVWDVGEQYLVTCDECQNYKH